MEELLTEINRIVGALKSLNHSNDLDGRWRNAELLAANNFYLSEKMTEARTARNLAEYNYNAACSLSEAMYTGPVTKAKAWAKNENKALYKEYLDADGYYHRVAGIFEANKGVLESIRQSVAVLRNEQRNS